MTTKTKEGKREPFEKSLEKLETTVRELEDGEKGLEELRAKARGERIESVGKELRALMKR